MATRSKFRKDFSAFLDKQRWPGKRTQKQRRLDIRAIFIELGGRLLLDGEPPVSLRDLEGLLYDGSAPGDNDPPDP